MSNEATFDMSAYDEFLKDASKDDAVGPQEFIVGDVVLDYWADGSERCKVKGSLPTAGGATCDVTFSAIPSPAELAASAGTMDSRRKKGIAASIAMQGTLAKHYGKGYKDIKPGEKYKVQVTRDKRNFDGSGGFLRVRAFLAKDHAVGNGSSAPVGGNVPF